MNLKFAAIICIVVALCLTSCATAENNRPSALSRSSLDFNQEDSRPFNNPDQNAAMADMVGEPTGVITARQAMAAALINNPKLTAYAWEIRAAEASALQAGLLPNPELEIELEEFGGSGDLSGLDASETTLQLSQLIELGAKRPKRTQIFHLKRDLAQWDYESKRLDVLTEAMRRFIEVLASQEHLALAHESVRLAQEIHDTVEARVTSGRVAPVEMTKSKIALSAAQIELRHAESDLEIARAHLAATWGSASAAFEKVAGEFEGVKVPPSIKQLASDISGNPDIERWITEVEHHRASVDLERANGIPDLTVAGGVKYLEETGDNAFIVGISLPLPLFDRNQGGIREAQSRLSKVHEEQKATELGVSIALAETHQKLSSAYEDAITLKNEILTGSQSAFDVVNQMYRQGKAGYLDVLDSQRTLIEARAHYIDALATYHKALADMERLLGKPIDDSWSAKSNE